MMAGALPERASVVIIGGGVIGTSIAFHLAEAGVPDVLLLERDALASGSTARAAGGVRTQFSDELNIRIALRSIEAFMGFGERPGRRDRPAPGRLPVRADDARAGRRRSSRASSCRTASACRAGC